MAASKAKISPKTKQEFLPQEILFEIFVKLPAKSAGKFRCLSNFWSTQLSTPDFIQKHLKNRQSRSLQLNQENIVLVYKREEPFVVITCPTNKQEESRKDISPYLDFGSHFVIGSCNGLLLLRKYKELILINPITLKQVKLPDIRTTKPNLIHAIYGFGYDCVSDEYKIVAVTFCFAALEMEMKIVAQVYSVKQGGPWRVVNDGGLLGGMFRPNTRGVLLNGTLHWEAETVSTNHSRIITVFDLASESFRRIQSPSKLTRDMRYSNVMALGGCLCTVDSGGGSVDLWIMKEYGVVESWTNIRINGDGMWEAIRLLCVAGDEKVLGVSDRDKWYLCDLRERTCKEVAVGVEVKTLYTGGCPFVDSLVDPEQLVNFPKEVAG